MDIELGRFEEYDITEQYLSWLSDRFLMRFSSQLNIQHDVNTSRAYIDELRTNGGDLLKIVLSNTQEMIGTLSFRKTQKENIDLGIMIGRNDLRGKGVGTNAWELGMSYAWDFFLVSKITAGTNSKHGAMLKIFQKSGMHFEKTVIEEEETFLIYSKLRPRQ
jgi:RimJ/RimL family protein N-acetyltransferase